MALTGFEVIREVMIIWPTMSVLSAVGVSDNRLSSSSIRGSIFPKTLEIFSSSSLSLSIDDFECVVFKGLVVNLFASSPMPILLGTATGAILFAIVLLSETLLVLLSYT